MVSPDIWSRQHHALAKKESAYIKKAVLASVCSQNTLLKLPKISIVLGTRPEIIKLSQIIRLVKKENARITKYHNPRSDVLVLGSRLDIRQTGSQTVAFKGDNNIS